MRRILCLYFALSLGLAAFGQQAKQALTNEDITKMAKGGFTEEVIVALIQSKDTDFNVSIGGLTALKEAGISGKVMEAMLKAEAKKREGSNALSAAATSPAQSAANAPPSPPAPVMVPNPAMSMGGGAGYAQQMMASVMAASGMSGGMPGMLDMNQMPPLALIAGNERQQVRPSTAQVAHTDTKGDSMPGTGTGALSMLMGLGRQALSFAAIGGSMFAGPAAGMAASMMGGMGGMGGHHGPPKVTYVWALPGLQSAFVVPSTKPRFEMLFGNLVGIDPDAYEPFLVKLVNSKDNWRLVGATKSTMGQMGTEAYEKVTEVRVACKPERLGRGQVQIEPNLPIEPGEYAVVLRALHPGKRSEGSLGGGAERTIFFSVWDFSIRNDAAQSKR